MIPKTIHYCWFGRNPKPKLAEKCIKSWKKYCPDYEIIEWNEDNYDISKNSYMKEAYEAKKWGFVPDYARLDIIYSHGGIYLDTDVEIIKPLDHLLNNKAFAGLEPQEDATYVALGLGFGAEKGNPLIRKLMDSYEECHFLKEDGNLNLTPAPVLNSETLKPLGFDSTDRIQDLGEMMLYPSEYFCPLLGGHRRTENTVSIHWYSGSWLPEKERKQQEEYVQKLKKELNIRTIKHAIKAIVGEDTIRKIRKVLRK